MLSLRHSWQQGHNCRSKRELCSLKMRIGSLLNTKAFLFNLEDLKQMTVLYRSQSCHKNKVIAEWKKYIFIILNIVVLFSEIGWLILFSAKNPCILCKTVESWVNFLTLKFQKIDLWFYRFYSKKVRGIINWRQSTL